MMNFYKSIQNDSAGKLFIILSAINKVNQSISI